MKNTFTRFLIASIAVLFFSSAYAQFPTIYASVATGTWPTLTTWETFTGNATNTPGPIGTGTPAASAPSGTHHIYIRAGHTVTMTASKNAMGVTIEPGGTLTAGGIAATLKVAAGGTTTFLGPNNVSVLNNGTLGLAGDVITFEVPIAAGTVDIGGTGTYLLGRIRMVGGNPNNPVVNVNQDLTLVQSANYALTAAYNPQAADNNTINIAAGKTVKVAGATGGYLHSNSQGSGSGYGTYTYNINGTLDLTDFTGTTQVTSISPVGGTVNVNINGALKTGNVFNSSPVAPGVANISVPDGVTVDATLATVMSFKNNVFSLTGTGALKRTVPNDGTKTRFPIGANTPTSTSQTPVTINGTTGPIEVFTATVKNTFTNAPPSNTLPKEWNIVEATPGGNEDTLRFEWSASDEASGFTHSNTVFIIRWNGSAWEYTPASVTISGNPADTFTAKGTGFTSFGLFALTNSNPTPVAFANVRVAQMSSGVQVEFSNSTELDVRSYVIERSADGHTFTPIATLAPKTNNGSLNSYSFTDINATSGNNFYRIKATETSGHIIYSFIAKLSLNGIKSGFSAYPNPVKDKTFSVQLENLEKDVYGISLINKLGQTVYTKQYRHQGGSATMVIELPATASKGVYNLQVRSASFNSAKNIIVE